MHVMYTAPPVVLKDTSLNIFKHVKVGSERSHLSCDITQDADT